uniref:RNA-directed RNA polymerase L n=1 Tax=Coptotermes formosanus phenuivirus 1 TaxID=3133454 RepID=A0AAT9JFJ0_9VIRU
MMNIIAKGISEEQGLRGVLITSPHTIQNVRRRLVLPDFELDYNPLESSVTFKSVDEISPEDASSITEHIRPGLTFSTEDLRTFSHDFTFRILSNETDKRLDQIFPPLGDGNDDLTPDDSYSDDECLAIFEYTTTRNPRNMKTPYMAKMAKYVDPLIERVAENRDTLAMKVVSYTVIVVSDDKLAVSQHCHLTQDLVDELIARFVFSQRVLARAQESGVVLTDDPISQQRMDLIQKLAAIPFSQEKFYVNGDPGIEYDATKLKHPEISEELAGRYTTVLYSECFAECITKVGYGEKSKATLEAEVENWKKTVLGDRRDQKSVLQLPGTLPISEKTIEDLSTGEGHSACSRLWDETISKIRLGELNLTEYSEEEMLASALGVSTDPDAELYKDMKGSYHRVKLSIDDNDRIELAKVGISGKKYSGFDSVIEYRDEKKKSFHIDVSTTDIEEYMNKEFYEYQLELSESTRGMIHLIKVGIELHGNAKKDYLDDIVTFCKSPDHQWMEMISDIGCELSISLKQGVKKDNFIYKKLRNFNLHMLIKPTRSDSHIFVSFMIPKDQDNIDVVPEGISKAWEDCGSYLCTDFVSFSVSKLVNLVKSDAFSVCMYGQWRRFYKNKPLRKIPNDSDVWKMWRLSQLIHLEDKARTEEIITLFRYISMEKFCQSAMDQTKMLSKMPNILRSRLQVFFCNKLLHEMTLPAYHIQDRNPDAMFGWANIRNPYTGRQIQDPNDLVELFYLGYAKNKDEVSSANTDFQLVKKIIKHEMALYTCNKNYLGFASSPIPVSKEKLDEFTDLREGAFIYEKSEVSEVEALGTHEFSLLPVLAAADNLKVYWASQYGRTWDKKITQLIADRLAAITWEQIATLKASSTFDPEEKIPRGGKVVTKRMKVIIAILKNHDLIKGAPIDSLLDVLNWVDSDGGLRVDIFKKNQHAGLREIYVLEFHSRFLQLFIEEISRAICSTLPMEMMMHPEDKIRRPQEHIISAVKRSENHKFSCNSSNDAATWNQGHYVPKFQTFLMRCLPEEFHPLIERGLVQWVRKRIKLPDGVINLLANDRDINFYGKEEQACLEAYRGKAHQPWMKEESTYMSVASGMMQGILHYTSSAFHAAMLMIRDKLFRRVMKQLGYKVLTTDLVSSDDSSRLVDVFSDDLDLAHRALIYARADQLAITKFSTHFGITMSVKSTMCTSNVLEFNSEFYFKASLARPTIKWAYAALSVLEVESLYERQEVMYNQLTELLEGGAGFYQTHVTQVAQAFLHYRLLGHSINRLWYIYSDELSKCCDPTLGFFLLDNPIAAGLLGMNYNLWVASCASGELNSRLALQLRSGSTTSTSRGSLMNGVQIRFGNRQKIMRLIQEAEEVLPDWRERIEKDPQVLYMFPTRKDEMLVRMMVKLTSPNVTTSLAKGNTISRMMSSSVYTISHHAITLGSAWIESLERERFENKLHRTSLMKLIRNQGIRDDMILTTIEETTLFPLRSMYQETYDILTTLNLDVLVPSPLKKKLRSQIMVFPTSTEAAFPLEKICRWKWFDQYIPTSTRVLNKTWDYFKSLYPWLRDTIDETLLESPFESHISLRNFIARQTTKNRIVHLTGGPVRSKRTAHMVISAITLNQFPSYELEPMVLDTEEQEEFKEKTSPIRNVQRLQSDLAVNITFPYKRQEKTKIVEDILVKKPLAWDGSVIRPAPRIQRLAMIQLAAKIKKNKDPADCEKLFNMIEMTKSSCIGGWVRRQKLIGNEWKGRGIWLGIVGATKARIVMDDSDIVELTVNSIEQARKDKNLLRTLASDLKLRPNLQMFKTSPTGWRWNGIAFSRDLMGVPVIESDLLISSQIFPSDIHLNHEGNSIYLNWRQDRANISVCSYHVLTSDFLWDFANVEGKHPLFKAWAKNQPMEHHQLENLLNTARQSDFSKKLDRDEFISFIKKIMTPSLARFGFSSSVFDFFVPAAEEYEEEIEMNYDIDDIMDQMLTIEGNMDIITAVEAVDETGGGSDEDKVLDENGEEVIDNTIEYGLETGLSLMSSIEYSYAQRKREVHVYSDHKLFNDLMVVWLSRARFRGSRLLSAGLYDKHLEDIAENIQFYVGRQMRPNESHMEEIAEEDEDYF